MTRASGARAGSRMVLMGVSSAVVISVVAVGVGRLLGGADEPTAPPPDRTCDITPADGEAAITAAIAECPDGTTVRFPSGAEYRQSTSIRMQRRSDLVIDGNGSTFISSAANNDQFNPNWMVVEGANVTLHSMFVQGNFKMQGPRSLERMQQQFPSGNHFNAGVAVYGGRGVTIRDITIRDTFGDGALVAPSGILPGGAGPHAGVPHDVRLQRLSITRTARQGVAVTGGDGVWLEDSRINDSWYLGVDLEIDVPGQTLRDVHIVGNTFDGSFFGAIAIPWPGDGRSVEGIEIRANRTLRPPDGCGAQISVNATPGQTALVTDVVTEQNELLTLSRGIVYRNVRSGSVRDNRVEKRPGPPCGDPEAAAVTVSDSSGVAVERNASVNY
jgi:hypothetical protein